MVQGGGASRQDSSTGATWHIFGTLPKAGVLLPVGDRGGAQVHPARADRRAPLLQRGLRPQRAPRAPGSGSRSRRSTRSTTRSTSRRRRTSRRCWPSSRARTPISSWSPGHEENALNFIRPGPGRRPGSEDDGASPSGRPPPTSARRWARPPSTSSASRRGCRTWRWAARSSSRARDFAKQFQDALRLRGGLSRGLRRRRRARLQGRHREGADRSTPRKCATRSPRWTSRRSTAA